MLGTSWLQHVMYSTFCTTPFPYSISCSKLDCMIFHLLFCTTLNVQHFQHISSPRFLHTIFWTTSVQHSVQRFMYSIFCTLLLCLLFRVETCSVHRLLYTIPPFTICLKHFPVLHVLHRFSCTVFRVRLLSTAFCVQHVLLHFYVQFFLYWLFCTAFPVEVLILAFPGHRFCTAFSVQFSCAASSAKN